MTEDDRRKMVLTQCDFNRFNSNDSKSEDDASSNASSDLNSADLSSKKT